MNEMMYTRIEKSVTSSVIVLGGCSADERKLVGGIPRQNSVVWRSHVWGWISPADRRCTTYPRFCYTVEPFGWKPEGARVLLTLDHRPIEIAVSDHRTKIDPFVQVPPSEWSLTMMRRNQGILIIPGILKLGMELMRFKSMLKFQVSGPSYSRT